MKSKFPFRITEEHLFCRHCCNLQLHGIYAKETYSVRGGLLPKIPLLCICDSCQTYHIAFSQEFAFAVQDSSNQEYAKIPGKNRLAIGNWVYIKGRPRPGIIKRLFSDQQNQKSLSIDYGNNETEQVQLSDTDTSLNETAPKGYRLLPAQSGETLIGDYVYHVIRDAFGKAIGLVHDGETDKLAIQLEDSTILFLTLSPAYQSLPNKRLEETIKYKLKDLPSKITENIVFKAKSGILYLSGTVESLAERRQVLDLLNIITSMRGIFNTLTIKPKENQPDNILEDKLCRIFEDALHPDLAYYEIKVNNRIAQVRIGYYSEQAVHFFEEQIEQLPGIVELSLLPECVILPSPQEQKKIQELEKGIRAATDTSNKIYIRLANDKIYVLGRVKTLIQKHKIHFSVTNQAFRFLSIANLLRVTSS